MIDWIFAIPKKIVDSMVWKSLVARYAWIDWVSLVFLISALISGGKRGLGKTITKTVVVVITVYLTLEFYVPLADILKHVIGFLSAKGVLISSFVIVGLVSFVALRFLSKSIYSMFEGESNTIGTIISIIVAVLRQALFLSLFCQIVSIGSFKKLEGAFGEGESYTGLLLSKFAPATHEIIDKPVAAITEFVASKIKEQ